MMQEFIEREVACAGASVFIGSSQWSAAEAWVCPPTRYVVCQRLSEGHSPLRLSLDRTGPCEVYPRVRALGFMPSSGRITMHPLGKPLRTLNCWFDKDYFETATEIDAGGWQDLAGDFLPMVNRNLETMMQRIHLELARPGFGSELAIEAAASLIAIEMARLGKKRHSRDPHGGVQAGLVPWQLARLRDRIAASLELGYPRVQELAELCGVSSSHLMRMFKVSTGWSLHRYVAGERLRAARQLLAEDCMSIKAIAAGLGFSSASHFTNAFQREEQLTPSEFRRRTRSARAASDAVLRVRPGPTVAGVFH